MRMKNGTGVYATQCQISPARDLRFYSQVPCSLEPETIAYAVCRFFTKSAHMCRFCVSESYRMRLASGKGRRAKRCRATLPAVLMDLPGSWAQVRFTIDAVGVTVQEVRLLRCYPQT